MFLLIIVEIERLRCERMRYLAGPRRLDALRSVLTAADADALLVSSLPPDP